MPRNEYPPRRDEAFLLTLRTQCPHIVSVARVSVLAVIYIREVPPGATAPSRIALQRLATLASPLPFSLFHDLQGGTKTETDAGCKRKR